MIHTRVFKSINKHLAFVLSFALLVAFGLMIEVSLLVPVFIGVLYFCLRQYRRGRAVPEQRMLHLVFLFVSAFAASYFILHTTGTLVYVPFSLLAIIATLLFEDLVIALLLVLAYSLSFAALLGNNLSVCLMGLISGLCAILLVRHKSKRTDIILAGVIIGIVQALCAFLIARYNLGHYGTYLALFINGIASSLIALALLPIFEIIFQTVTTVSLQEMAENHILLQRLMQEAPGTYHHSRMVGDLAYAASARIGAHALLARVGAYYHDIGKLAKPDYFSENMQFSTSRHENLAPTMSKLVIMNHVKEGVEVARHYHLNPRLVDFIRQHHGTSLVYYFYRRALEELEEDHEVREEGFRYPGPRPLTKEIAIVLLADSVEAAARALKDPTQAKIEEVVHKIINNKFIDHQLDQCDLTLRDLETIASVFIHVLSGIYHNRVMYP